MKRQVIALGLTLLMSPMLHAASAANQGDAAAGKTKVAVCGACHGADGNSVTPNFPKLAGQGSKYLVQQLTDIRDGTRSVPEMVGQLNNMSDQDLLNIAAFYSSQAASGGQAKEALVPLGQQIFRGGIAARGVPACSACHSPTGKGNASAGYPALAGQHATYISNQLKKYRQGYDDENGRTNDGEAKIMRTVAFGLSDKEIEAVSSYVSGLK